MRFAILCVFLILTGCGGKINEAQFFAQREDLPPAAKEQEVLVATSVTLKNLNEGFGAERTAAMTYHKGTVSLPPARPKGGLPIAKTKADPKRHMAVIGSLQNFMNDPEKGDKAAFLRKIEASEGADRGEVVIFVHGYNTNLGRATLRLAQIKEDFGVKLPSIAYVWPSAAATIGYFYDRDSAAFARDDLEELIDDMNRSGRKVFLVAHSMGTYLTMETLRQMEIRQEGSVRRKISALALLSPDIALDVFERQITSIGKGDLPKHSVVFTSVGDRALGLASFITGGVERLGRVATSQSDDATSATRRRLRDHGLTILQVDRFRNGDDDLGHNIQTDSEEAIRCIVDFIEIVRNVPKAARKDQANSCNFPEIVELVTEATPEPAPTPTDEPLEEPVIVGETPVVAPEPTPASESSAISDDVLDALKNSDEFQDQIRKSNDGAAL